MNDKVSRLYTSSTDYKEYTKSLTCDEVKELIGGYITSLNVGPIQAVFDEDWELKRLPHCFYLNGVSFSGKVLLGLFSKDGLHPIPRELMDLTVKNIICDQKEI